MSKIKYTNQYATWEFNDEDETPEDGFYQISDTIEDAVGNSLLTEPEVFEVSYKSLGKYKVQSKAIKITSKK